MNTCRLPKSGLRAFTLVELIAVMAIIILIGTFVAPSAATLLRGSQVTQASQILTDQLSLARQEALSRSTPIEVRFLRFADPEAGGETAGLPSSGKFRAIELMEVTPGGRTLPLKDSRVIMLPNSVMMNPNKTFSSLISVDSGTPPKTPTASDVALPRNIGRNYDYVSFRFLQNGSTDLLSSSTTAPTDGGTADYFVTIHAITDQPKLTSNTDLKKINFFTLVVDAVSGGTKGYRPNAL